MESFVVYFLSDDIEVIVCGKLVIFDFDFKLLVNFEWKVKQYGYFRVIENEIRFNFINVGGVIFIGVLGFLKFWGLDGEGLEGWIDYVFFLFLYWFVYSLGLEINYNWFNDNIGELLRGRKGFVYQEKNWGKSFLLVWIWVEGVDGFLGFFFVVFFGVFGIDIFNIFVYLIGYRSLAVIFNFKLINFLLIKFIDGCSGRMNVIVIGLDYKFEFEIYIVLFVL